MDGESLDTKHDNLQRLKELFPELFAESQLDWEKLKAAFGDNINFANERYVLNWAGKNDVFKVLQQPTTATLKPIPEESVNFDTTQNLFIEGENLEVLKALQKAYCGKVKCIIIDPPYNTGSDSFIYPDRFSEKKEDYLKRIGDKDEEGFLMKEGLFRKNSKDSGHYHSNWLSMMYPRLFLAKNLLRDDGVIFVHIDDNEVHNLRMVMNEIFGEENFVCQFTREAIKGGSQSKFVRETHDYILVFAKKVDELEFTGFEKEEIELKLKDEKGSYAKGRELNKWGAGSRREDSPGMWFPIKGPNGEIVYPIRNDGSEGRWRLGKTKMKKLLEDGDAIFEKRENGTYVVYEKLRGNKSKYTQFITILKDKYLNAKATEDLKDLFEKERAIFDFSKPSVLVKDLLFLSDTDDNDIILDFFAGSGTTAQAVLELNKDGGNRKFILVQMPEQCEENSEAFKAGYKTIADIGKERIRRVIQRIEKEKVEKPDLFAEGNLDLGFKAFKLSPSNFKIWRGAEIDSEEKLVEQLDAFTNPVREGSEKENMLFELMLKAGSLLTDKIEYKNKFYSVNNGEKIFALEEMNQKIIDKIIAAKPQKVITLDSLFTGNDQLKTNTVLQMRDAGVDFKTI